MCLYLDMSGLVYFSGWEAIKDHRKTLSADQEPTSGRVYTMYHGTHLKNAEIIIRNGFVRSKDGLLGPGIYVSRNIDKAKCYPPNTPKNDKVVFKLKVQVGKVKKIDCDHHPLQKAWHQNGYDCAWIPPHSKISTIKSGREEDCVWDPTRITLAGVACCVDDDTRKKLRQMIHRGRKRKDSDFDLCHQDESDGAHDVQTCWDCGDRICPFQGKHLCR